MLPPKSFLKIPLSQGNRWDFVFEYVKTKQNRTTKKALKFCFFCKL